MKAVLKIELDQTNDNRYFCVLNIPDNPKDYVTEDQPTARRALLRALTLFDRIAKE